MIRKNSKKPLVKPEFLVSISNKLALAKYSAPLSLRQFQLLFYIIIHEQRGFTYDLLRCDFDKTISKRNYSSANLRNDIEVLRDLMLNLGGDVDCYIEVFRNIEYLRGKIHFEFNEEFLLHIKDLKDNYVLLNYAAIGKFESVYSCKLYIFIRAKFGYWNLTFSKMELIELLEVERHSSYLKNDNMFEYRVLNTAVNEICFISELTVIWDRIPSYREPTSYKLRWTRGTYEKAMSTKQEQELMYYIKTIKYDLPKVLGSLSVEVNDLEVIKSEINEIENEIKDGLKASDFKDRKKKLLAIVKYCERYAY